VNGIRDGGYCPRCDVSVWYGISGYRQIFQSDLNWLSCGLGLLTKNWFSSTRTDVGYAPRFAKNTNQIMEHIMTSPIHVINDAKVIRSQRYFNKLSLAIYDLVLYGFISKYAWGASIQRLDAHYRKYVTSNHLEVGVGTGYLLNRIEFPKPMPRLALMDLSVACLKKTKSTVSRYVPEIYVQNLLEPMRHNIRPFESIGINYVLHCVPGDIHHKCQGLLQLKTLLKPDGILFGTTVLSKGVSKNILARPAMWLFNMLGVFNNRQDSATDLEKFLRTHFQILEFELIGVTAFFAVKIK